MTAKDVIQYCVACGSSDWSITEEQKGYKLIMLLNLYVPEG